MNPAGGTSILQRGGTRLSHRRFCAAMPLSMLVCAFVGCGKGEERDRLVQKTAAQLQAARAKADACDFEGAYAILGPLRDEAKKSRAISAATYGKLVADIEAVRGTISGQEAECKKKIAAGWRIIDGRLVSPAEQERALAESRRREEEKRERLAEERRVAEARAKAEAEARAGEEEQRREQARMAADKLAAERLVAEATHNLPSLQAVLNDGRCAVDQLNYITIYLVNQLVASGGKQDYDPKANVMTREDLARFVRAAAPASSPLLVAYRADVLDILESLAYPAYIATLDERGIKQTPIRFASYVGEPLLLVGSVLSDTVFNNVNQAVNTPKKRAASFMQKEVLPVLLNVRIPDRLKSARLGYFGIVFVYGNRNFLRDSYNPSPESLCIVLSTRDYVAFMKRELSQEALLKSSSVFLASESPSFVKVELTLE